MKIETIEDLRKLFCKEFQGAKIILFGSRAKGCATPYSDIDIAIETDENIEEKITSIKYLLEESLLPYKVDIIDLKKSKKLQEMVKKEGIVWHCNKSG